MDDLPGAEGFALLNEIGIIAQLSRALFEARLPRGVGVPQFSVVNHLVRLGDGKTPLELARAFQVPKTTMTHTVQTLEALGHVRIAPNPRDRRSKCVWLTAEGRAFRDAAIRSLAPDLAEMAEALDGERLAALLPELRRIRVYLDENRPA